MTHSTETILAAVKPPEFWQRVAVGADDACWPWQGKLRRGYGMMARGPHASPIYLQSHRVAFTLARGPIPDGLVIDHLCRNRACCNPSHLEPVTSLENTRRGLGGAATGAALRARETCANGHAWAEGSFYLRKDGRGRVCRACVKIRQSRMVERRATAAASS